MVGSVLIIIYLSFKQSNSDCRSKVIDMGNRYKIGDHQKYVIYFITEIFIYHLY
jgi:hypothetical protein